MLQFPALLLVLFTRYPLLPDPDVEASERFLADKKYASIDPFKANFSSPLHRLSQQHRSSTEQNQQILSMASLTAFTLSTPIANPKAALSLAKPPQVAAVAFGPWRRTAQPLRMRSFMPVAASPESIEEKVADSIKQAEEACAGDPVSGECVAAWDEVEELSAAASHARDKKKQNSDPLETYCKDNPETDECRTYDN